MLFAAIINTVPISYKDKQKKNFAFNTLGLLISFNKVLNLTLALRRTSCLLTYTSLRREHNRVFWTPGRYKKTYFTPFKIPVVITYRNSWYLPLIIIIILNTIQILIVQWLAQKIFGFYAFKIPISIFINQSVTLCRQIWNWVRCMKIDSSFLTASLFS